mmetsp:Transcript_18497/g.52844  ORF Transcript_18497/g.52844 Transcript_18497/m.52844 type:complete len:160 (-) Transcript_18497:276-755(-)
MPPSLLPGASLVWLAVGHPRYTRGDKRKCLNNYAYRLATALTLGITFPLASLAPSCTCGASIDTLGDHFFLCSRATAERVFKHNTLLDVFKAILAEVGITAVTEVPLRSLDITPPKRPAQQPVHGPLLPHRRPRYSVRRHSGPPVLARELHRPPHSSQP